MLVPLLLLVFATPVQAQAKDNKDTNAASKPAAQVQPTQVSPTPMVAVAPSSKLPTPGARVQPTPPPPPTKAPAPPTQPVTTQAQTTRLAPPPPPVRPAAPTQPAAPPATVPEAAVPESAPHEAVAPEPVAPRSAAPAPPPVSRPAVAQVTRVDPTLGPTPEPTAQVIDISNDPNAHATFFSQALARPTAIPTPAPAPAATALPTSVSDQDLINGVVLDTLDPLLVGGQLGLIAAGLAALGLFALQRVRQRRSISSAASKRSTIHR